MTEYDDCITTDQSLSEEEKMMDDSDGEDSESESSGNKSDVETLPLYPMKLQ